MGLPILDTTFAIVRRFRGGVPIFKPDKGHLHHRLLNLGFTQRQAVFLIYVISAVLGLSAIALTEVSSQIAILILAIVIVAIFLRRKKIGSFKNGELTGVIFHEGWKDKNHDNFRHAAGGN